MKFGPGLLALLQSNLKMFGDQSSVLGRLRDQANQEEARLPRQKRPEKRQKALEIS
jgi:hypothetical protein